MLQLSVKLFFELGELLGSQARKLDCERVSASSKLQGEYIYSAVLGQRSL